MSGETLRAVILGAGQAGYSVAKTLRSRGFSGDITLVGDESHPPYDRPPLSKEVLLNLRLPQDVYYATLEQLSHQRIDLRLSTRAREIDRAGKTVIFDDAQRMRYDVLVIATGGRPRTITVAGVEDAQLYYLRTLEHSTSLGALLRRGIPLVVVGGGWIGLEAASAAKKTGAPVTVVEAASQLCMRALPAGPADFLLRLHRREGVDVRLNSKVERVAGDTAILSSGEKVPCGALIAGVGMIPNTELAVAAELEVEDGILVDSSMRTSDPNIFAAGDVARHRSSKLGRSLRFESWSNAQNGASAVAAAIMGETPTHEPVPWFWSEQHGTTLQIVGIPEAHHRVIERGDPSSDGYSFVYLNEGAIAAAVSINQPRDYRLIRKMIEKGKSLDEKWLADAQFNLQEVFTPA